MAVAVADILSVRFIFDIPGEVAIISRHYRVSAIAGASRDELQIANQLQTTFGAFFGPMLNNVARFVQTEVQKIKPLPKGATAYSTAAVVAGSTAGDMLPPQVAGIVTLRTALAGRANRGRSYIPYPSESNNTSQGLPAAGYITQLIALAGALDDTQVVVSGADSATLVPVVFHRLSTLTTDITAGYARSYWTTQRRRNNGNF